MKGSLLNMPISIVMMLVAMLLTVSVFVYTTVQFHEYQITTFNRQELRLMIDVAEGILGDECLVKKRGMFDAQKLDAGRTCVSVPADYSIQIEDIDKRSWGISVPLSLEGEEIPGTVGPNGEIRSLYFPCNVYYPEKIVACKMIIRMG